MNIPAKIHGATEFGAVLDEVRDREALGAGREEHGEECDEHQRRAEHGVQEELQGRVLTLFATPHADHEVHRQQDDLEEDEEENEVLGDERSRHAHLENEHEDEERLRIPRVRNVIEAVDDDEKGDHHAEEIQREADAVEADEVAALDERDPLGIGDELHRAGLREVEAQQRDDADDHGCNRRGERHELDRRFLRTRYDDEDCGAEERQERADAQQPVVVGQHVHCFIAPVV